MRIHTHTYIYIYIYTLGEGSYSMGISTKLPGTMGRIANATKTVTWVCLKTLQNMDVSMRKVAMEHGFGGRMISF